jgi:hypothetical protein
MKVSSVEAGTKKWRDRQRPAEDSILGTSV